MGTNMGRKGQPIKHDEFVKSVDNWQIYGPKSVEVLTEKVENATNLKKRAFQRFLNNHMDGIPFDGVACRRGTDSDKGWFGWRIKERFHEIYKPSGSDWENFKPRAAFVRSLQRAYQVVPRSIILVFTLLFLMATITSYTLGLEIGNGSVAHINILARSKNAAARNQLRKLLLKENYQIYRETIIAAIASSNARAGEYPLVCRNLDQVKAIFIVGDDPFFIGPNWETLRVGSLITIGGNQGYVYAMTRTDVVVKSGHEILTYAFPRQKVFGIHISRTSPITIFENEGNLASIIKALSPFTGIQLEKNFSLEGSIVGHFEADNLDSFFTTLCRTVDIGYDKSTNLISSVPTQLPRLYIGFSSYFPKNFHKSLRDLLQLYANQIGYRAKVLESAPLKEDEQIAFKASQFSTLIKDLGLNYRVDKHTKEIIVL